MKKITALAGNDVVSSAILSCFFQSVLSLENSGELREQWCWSGLVSDYSFLKVGY